MGEDKKKEIMSLVFETIEVPVEKLSGDAQERGGLKYESSEQLQYLLSCPELNLYP